jgi:hypothetical protein
MKISSGKFCQIALAIIISCVAAYGISHALPGYCNEPVNTCVQASGRARCDVTFGIQCKAPFQVQSSENQLSVTSARCSDPSEACCTAAEGRDSAQAVFLNPCPPQYCGKTNTTFEVVDLDNNLKYNLPSHTTVIRPHTPLYIEIESMLC